MPIQGHRIKQEILYLNADYKLPPNAISLFDGESRHVAQD
jgi:hypothetical protein